jgi:hypothetical protein
VAGRTPPPGATGDAKVKTKITTRRAGGSVDKQMSDDESAGRLGLYKRDAWSRMSDAELAERLGLYKDPDASPEPDAYTEHYES